jgi:myo-inositol catabolism protein IolS
MSVQKISTLGLGCWSFGGGFWLDQNYNDSIRTIHTALRAGIRHFDTAQGYGNGRSEQITGQQIRRFSQTIPRETITIASKIFLPPDPSMLRKMVETSLKRLCTTYLDILYIHWPDSKKNHLPYLNTLVDIVDEGLIRSIGVSNFTPELLHQAASRIRISHCQFPSSLLWIRSLHKLGPYCEQNGIKIVTYSPLGLGLLTGKYRTSDDFKSQDRRRNLFYLDTCYRKTYWNLLDTLSCEANKLHTSQSNLALAWAIRQNVSTVLLGARNRMQLEDNLNAYPIDIPEETMQALETASYELDAMIPPNEDNPFFHRW